MLWNPFQPLRTQTALVGFVRYTHPMVQAIVSERRNSWEQTSIERVLSGHLPAHRFTGLRGGATPAQVDREIAAVYDFFAFVHRPRWNYVGEPFQGFLKSQMIRDPGLVNDQGGTCIDLVCFVAAVIYCLGHFPLVVVMETFEQTRWTPSHAILGYWRVERGIHAVMNHRRLARANGHDDAIKFLDTTYLTYPDFRNQARIDAKSAIRHFGQIHMFLDRRKRHRVRYAVDVRIAIDDLKKQDPDWAPHGNTPQQSDTTKIVSALSTLGQAPFANRMAALSETTPVADLVQTVVQITDALVKQKATALGWTPHRDPWEDALEFLTGKNRQRKQYISYALARRLLEKIPCQDLHEVLPEYLREPYLRLLSEVVDWSQEPMSF